MQVRRVDIPNLSLPEYFINRELSALEFNRRVLHQVRDVETPLLERLKFMCIVSTNLDEYFEIRVSGLQQRLERGASPAGSDLLSPQNVLATISERAHALVDEQYRLLNEELIPALEAEGIRFIRRTRWTPVQREWLREIQPDGITLDELAEAIYPSRYVRGSDILDIFGR